MVNFWINCEYLATLDIRRKQLTNLIHVYLQSWDRESRQTFEDHMVFADPLFSSQWMAEDIELGLGQPDPWQALCDLASWQIKWESFTLGWTKHICTVQGICLNVNRRNVGGRKLEFYMTDRTHDRLEGGAQTLSHQVRVTHRVWRMEATLLKKVDKQCEWSVFLSDIANH